MPNNFYEDEAPADANEGVTVTEKPESDNSDMEESDTQTALLPKSFFMGKDKRPGDTCRVKVTKVFDDEVQIAYVAHDKSDEDESKSEDMGEMGEEGEYGTAMSSKDKSYYE